MELLTSYRFINRLPATRVDLSVMDGTRCRPGVCSIVLFIADCLAVPATYWCIRFAVFGPLVTGRRPLASPDAPVLLAAMVLYLILQGRYTERTTFWNESRLVVGAGLCTVGIEVAYSLIAGNFITRIPTFAFFLVFPAVATGLNRLSKHFLNQIGAWALPIVVIGDGPSAARAEAALASDPLLGYRFVGRVDPDDALSDGSPSRLASLLNRHGAHRLLVAIDDDGALQRKVIECALRERVAFSLVPHPNALPAFPFVATSCFGQDPVMLSYRDSLSQPFSRMIKVAIDVIAAALLLLLSSPLFVVLAVISRLDGGPMMFAHRRVGAGGRHFNCLKFRTMVVDGDHLLNETLAKNPALAAEWATSRKLTNDPRVTRIGRFMRKTSLDELPQLINVLRLEMSLVGPRPIVDSEIPLYGEAIAQYYATRPGLTGLWQVSGRSNTSYARRVQLDVWYVNNWTIWNDIAVLMKTIPAVIRGQGAH